MDTEDESTQLMTVNIYDTHSATTILKVNNETRACDICKAIAHKFDIGSDNAKFHSLVLVLTVCNSVNKYNTHCVRTLTQYECPLDIRGMLISKLIDKYNISDAKEVANTVRWYYKDIRTSPIEFGDSGEVTGEYDSDDEEEISHSDLAYLAKAERKGYLLKRSSKDQNLWRRWYCALTDHLWCVDINREDPRAICIKLSGMIRYKQGNHSSLDQVQTIIINSLKQTHFFRAFNVVEHRKWIEDLYVKTNYATDNDYFSMAEVIICDEELTKTRRIHKQVQDLLDLDAVYESIAENRLFSLPAEEGGETAAGGVSSRSSSAFMSALDGAAEGTGASVTPQRGAAAAAAGSGAASAQQQQPLSSPLSLTTPPTAAAAGSSSSFSSALAAAVDDLMVATLNDSESVQEYTRASSEEYKRLSGRVKAPATAAGAAAGLSDSARSSAAHTPLSRSSVGSFASVVNSTNTAADLAFAEAAAAAAACQQGGEEGDGLSGSSPQLSLPLLQGGDPEQTEREETTPPQSPSSPSPFQSLSRGTSTASAAAAPGKAAPATVAVTAAAPAATASLNPLDRSRKHWLIHRLHLRNRLLHRMMSFVLEVSHFKELFRHDLVVTSSEQIERAALIHARYLVPQLLAAGLFLGSSFISQYATKMTSTPVKRSSGSSKGATTVVNIRSNGTITLTPKGPGGSFSSSSSRGRSRSERSPMGSFNEQPPEQPGNGRTRTGSSFGSSKKGGPAPSHHHSRSNSRTDLQQQQQQQPPAECNDEDELDVAQGQLQQQQWAPRRVSAQWGINSDALLKIHLILHDTQDISAEDIERHGLTDFVHTLNSIKSTLTSEGAELRGGGSSSSRASGKKAPSDGAAATAPTAAAAAASSGFWSLFSAPVNPSGAASLSVNQPTSSKEQAAAERVPVGADLFDEAVNQLLDVISRQKK